MKIHIKHGDQLEPCEEPQIFDELEKKTEEVKPLIEEIESLMSEAKQLLSKKRKITSERLIYI